MIGRDIHRVDAQISTLRPHPGIAPPLIIKSLSYRLLLKDSHTSASYLIVYILIDHTPGGPNHINPEPTKPVTLLTLPPFLQFLYILIPNMF